MLEPLPLVSIITPSYNQAPFIEETILSVLQQDYANLEYIIVDGGSTDGSADIIRRYGGSLSATGRSLSATGRSLSATGRSLSATADPLYKERLVWWVSEKDQGQTDAINKGFAQARGDILAWINSDDTYLPHAVSEAVAQLQAHPQAVMVYGDANLVDEKGAILGRFPARQTDYARLRRGSVHIPQQSSFFRADAWKQVGPLDPTFYFAMDYDLWVRLARLGPLVYTPRLWANFRLHSSGKSVIADNRCWPEMLRVHYREGGSAFSRLYFKAKIRPLIYAWMPLRLRLWLRRKV